MLPGLFILLACQLLGTAVAHAAGLPIPGPVLGILFLLAFLALRKGRSPYDPASREGDLGLASDGLLRNLGLLFVPAGVGIVQSFGLVSSNLLAVAGALVGSVLATLLVTVSVFLLVSRWTAE